MLNLRPLHACLTPDLLPKKDIVEKAKFILHQIKYLQENYSMWVWGEFFKLCAGVTEWAETFPNQSKISDWVELKCSILSLYEPNDEMSDEQNELFNTAIELMTNDIKIFELLPDNYEELVENFQQKREEERPF